RLLLAAFLAARGGRVFRGEYARVECPIRETPAERQWPPCQRPVFATRARQRSPPRPPHRLSPSSEPSHVACSLPGSPATDRGACRLVSSRRSSLQRRRDLEGGVGSPP